MGYIPHNVLIDGNMIVRFTAYGFDDNIKNTLIDLVEEYLSVDTGIEEKAGEVNQKFRLFVNYPNPFNAFTVISYEVLEENDVTLTVFDISGRRIQTLVDDHRSAGNYSLKFNGDHLQSGVFFCELIVGPQWEIRKLVLLK